MKREIDNIIIEEYNFKKGGKYERKKNTYENLCSY